MNYTVRIAQPGDGMVMHYSRYCSVLLRRGQIVAFYRPCYRNLQFGVVSGCFADTNKADNSGIQFVVLPNTDDIILRSQYGTTVRYQWAVPNDIKAVAWVDDDSPLLFGPRETIDEILRQAYNQKFFERVENEQA